MYNPSDTITVVSSPTYDQRVIVRISGPQTLEQVGRIFSVDIGHKAGIFCGAIAVDDELWLDAKLYLFLSPHSYTGETLAEIHIYANQPVIESLMSSFLAGGLRMAGPGEFTARAYLNGKIDLAQAEAVNEIITGSNRFQLAAAEKLLSGRLARSTAEIRSAIMDLLSRIEAGLDFSGEDIEFITRNEAVERLGRVRDRLGELLSGSISYESVIDLPAVGIAGAPNAGKSSLLNKLLGQQRSIVSAQRKTTRDVLTGLLTLTHCRCVLFDCAGLVSSPDNIIDELAQQAAIERLKNASVVLFCIDVSKDDLTEDAVVRKLTEPQILIPVATKSDLLPEKALAERLSEFKELFGSNFIATSAKSGTGIEQLKDKIDREIIALATGTPQINTRRQIRDTRHEFALTARHKQAVNEAIESIDESIDELKAGNDEVTAMMLRAAYQAVSDIESRHVDEQILENIFSRFCIGK